MDFTDSQVQPPDGDQNSENEEKITQSSLNRKSKPKIKSQENYIEKGASKLHGNKESKTSQGEIKIQT